MEGVAVVTGSGRGLGRAIAVRLASTGMKVVVNYRKREEEAQSTVDYINGINGEAISVKADVSRRDGCSELFKSAIEKFGRLDVLVNNAGLGIYGKFEDYDEKAIDLQLGASLKSAIFCSQEAARRMDRGSIVNVSSLAGVVPARGLAIYSSAKAAMIALTRSLALELGP
ncbi:MAG: SDR family NAD(P)-dependent oxidoreductase, partial [Nitrososphaerota archaeon]|nr:SDR family NAD(P)-dependent oxidoreductase [Nitrososphaerota archaeon]